ncbi:hypothetical protein AAE478_004562 [Parahypoxylon ruwenzoriense]
MAQLPKGWKSDYDGTRWFYCYTATGLTQYRFPRPGDEFPELVGLGFGPLDLALGDGLVSEPQARQQSTANEGTTLPDRGGRNNIAPFDGRDGMSATGYFDPDSFMSFGLGSGNEVSPVDTAANTTPGPTPPASKSKPMLAELPEGSERILSPVGFVAELASGDTAKCAEELAPVELDSTPMMALPLQTNPRQGALVELPTHRGPAEQTQPAQQPVRDTMQPVDEYPLVSASFAYSPLKTATRIPDSNAVRETSPLSRPEQNVFASQRPADSLINHGEYETWKPSQGVTTQEEPRNSDRKSMALSSISVLQSQNTELGSMEHKRHSLPGSIGSSEATPGILRPPSAPMIAAAASMSSQNIEHSPIPTVLQPAAAPLKSYLPQDDSRRQSAQKGVPSLPGAGARHGSISFNSELSITAGRDTRPDLSQIPSALKPAHGPQSTPTPGAQLSIQMRTDNVHPSTHRVNTLPNSSSSHAPSPPRLGGPGILVFKEISSNPGLPTENVLSNNTQEGSGKPTDPLSTINHNTTPQMIHQSAEHFHSIINEPLPIVAPLSISKPQSPASPDKPTMVPPVAGALKPSYTQIPPVPNPPNSAQPLAPSGPSAETKPYSDASQAQRPPGQPTARISASQGASIHQSPYLNHPASSQGLTPSAPQVPGKASPPLQMQATGSASLPIQHQTAPHQGTLPQTGLGRPSPGVQAELQSVVPQHPPGSPSGQQNQAHVQRPPSISAQSQHHPQAPPHVSAVHSTPIGTHTQGQPPKISPPNFQAPIQRPQHNPGSAIHLSGGISFSGSISNQPGTAQATASNLQNSIQRPPSNSSSVVMSSGQNSFTVEPVTHAVGQLPNQSRPTGTGSGQSNPSPTSPPISYVSPLQSQVSSPAPSLASLYRPPSSASSYTQAGTPTSIAHQNSPNSPRPTVAQGPHIQGNPQVSQSPRPPVAGVSKPFPMLPGQVKPSPSQVGSPPVHMQVQPAPMSLPQALNPQGLTGPTRPTQLMQGNYVPNPSSSIPSQLIPGAMHQGQPRPPVQMTPLQQYTPAQSPQNMPGGGSYIQNSVGQINQVTNGQPMGHLTQGTFVQRPQISQVNQSSGMAGSPASTAQPFFVNQTVGQGQLQPTQAIGIQSGVPQTFGQGKPFNSSQAAAALSDAGKGMKKWAKKIWQNPALKQTTAAMGGAIVIGSMGGNAVAGASLANQIYNTSQSRPQQGGRPQRPPGLQHAYTTPPQVQGLPGISVASPYMQATVRPQQGVQPVSVQTPTTPGRPPMVQNPGLAGVPMNSIASQPRPNMMNQGAYQIPRPPVGRPPPPQAQSLVPSQPLSQMLSQPSFQVPLSQPIQAPLNQPAYQIPLRQPMYQAPLRQPVDQDQGGPDPYAALGTTIGSALGAALAADRPGAAAPASRPQPNTNNSGQQQEPQSEQNNSEQNHEEHYQPQHESHAEQQHHESQSEQQYAEHSGPHHEPYSEQYHESYEPQHQEGHPEQQHSAYSDPHHETYAEQQHIDTAHSEPHHEVYNEQQHTSNTEQNHPAQTEQHYMEQSEQQHVEYSGPPPAETHPATENSASESYFTPQADPASEITIINNNNTIYNSNVEVENTVNTNTTMYADTTTYANDTTYTDTANTNTEATAFTDASAYPAADTTYMDASSTNMSTETPTFADTTYMYAEDPYADTSYADASYIDSSAYADAAYVDAGPVIDVNMDVAVDMNMHMSETMYVDNSGMSGMAMEESFGVEASAYVEVDYSGGGWGGDEF